ncbi:LLM class flavin-dependent oxidoreductase [Gordonia polyisoprenivorans]|uniref:LLM class flavin-dependent oxidoreductase n=1 Tax=Gordonia polyisoprenivorans TaxID=84595 RepID=UPI001AD79705|nr:LLM class flavin-dependent oxidoreductase [Gordonia polyisoprenivorans]QTI70964.1 LLM class flavin-dependent oxidoreductase [Gordonia polyisoprenivorans]
MKLDRVALWSASFDDVPWAAPREAVGAERDGWGTLWLPEFFGREVVSLAALCLSATSDLVVATGIAKVWARDPLALRAAQQLLGEAHPERFLLGVGVSHPIVAKRRGGADAPELSPLHRLRGYVENMDASPYRDHEAPPLPRVIAALGPRMLELARELTDGAHTDSSPVSHTARAREVLGPDKWLIPEVKVMLGRSTDDARALASQFLPVRLPAYRANLLPSGFEEADLDGARASGSSMPSWPTAMSMTFVLGSRRISQRARIKWS